MTAAAVRSTVAAKLAAIALVAGMGFGATVAQAQLVYWDGTNTAANSVVNGGAGTWNASSTNWTNSAGTSNGSWPGGTNVPVFSGSSGGTVTVSGTQSIGGLTFTTGGYTLQSGTLSLAASTNTVTGTGTTTITSALSGGTGNAVVFEGDGTTVIPTMNSYTGGTTVNSGTVQLTTNGASCVGATSALGYGQLTVSQSATLIATGNVPFGCPVGFPSTSVSAMTIAGSVQVTPTASANLPATTLNGGTLTTTSGAASGGGLTWGTINFNLPVTVQANSTLGGLNMVNHSGTGSSPIAYSVSPGVTLTVSGYFGATSNTDHGFNLSGGGTMLFTSNSNSYTAATVVTNGTVAIGNGGTTGDISSTSGVSLGSTSANLQFNRSNAYSFGKVISGSGNVRQIGSGTTTLTAANTYSGSTTVSAGTLQIGGSGSLGSSGTYAGAISNAGTFQYSSSANQTLSGAISGGGALTKDTGTSTLTLSGSNSYTGATTVNAGTLQAGVANAAFGNNSAVTLGSSGTLALGSYNETIGSLSGTGSVTGTGTLTTGGDGTSTTFGGALGNSSTLALVKNGAGTFTLTGANTYTGSTTISAGTLQIGGSGSLGTSGGSGSYAGAIANNGIFRYSSSAAQTLSGVISGSGALVKDGSGTLTLNASNSYSGTTTVSAGTLTYGVAPGVPNASVVTVDSGATLDVNGKTVTRTADTTVNGTLALGAGGIVYLSAGSHSFANITGSGTIVIYNGALTLSGSFTNTGVNITLAGGNLFIAGGTTTKIGTLALGGSDGTVDFSSTGNANLTVTTLTPGTYVLTASNWTSGQDHFYATNISGPPAKDTPNIAPLNQIKLGSNTVAQTYWSSATATSNELLAAPPASSVTYWDGSNTTANNNPDGGNGTWDASSTKNWTTVDGSFNSTWPGGAAIANFGGTLGTVTVSGSPSIGGINFITSGYTITGGTELSLAQDSTINVVPGGTATIATPISGSKTLTISGGTLTLNIPYSPTTFSGAIIVSSGTLIDANFYSLGGVVGSTTVLDGASLGLSGSITTKAEPLTLNGTGVSSAGALYNASGSNTFAGPITLGSASTIANDVASTTLTVSGSVANGGYGLTLDGSSAITVSGAISGNGGIVKNGAGTSVLSNASNSYTGATTVNAGTLQAGVVSSAFGSNSAVTINGSGTLALGSYNQTIGSLSGSGSLSSTSAALTTGGDGTSTTFSGVISGALGIFKLGAGVFTLSGLNTYTSGVININAGTVQIGGSGSLAGGTFNSAINIGGTFQYSSSADQILNGSINGAGALIKDTGNSALTLGYSSNGYTGPTTVSAGRLYINGNQTSATGQVTVNGSGTLGGTGTVGGVTTVYSGGTLSPGGGTVGTTAGIGTLTFAKDLTLQSGSFTNIELGQVGTGSLNDLVAVTGNLALGGTLTVTKSNGGTISPGTYRLFTYTGGSLTGSFATVVPPAGYTATVDTSTAGQVNLVVVAIPRNYWDGSNTSPNSSVDGGSGTWDGSTTNWTTVDGSFNGTWLGGTAIANFGGTFGTVTVSGSPSIGGLNFTASGYQITGGTSLTLAQAAGNPITTPPGGNATIATPISGSYPMSFSGGTATLSGSSTGYTGAITVSTGALIAANANALGTTSGSVTVSSGASLGLSGGITTVAKPLVLSGTGVSSAGVLYNVSGSNTYAGPITLNTASTIANNVAGTTLTVSGNVTNGGNDLTLDGSSAVIVSGTISGGGSLRKTGAGTTTLSAANNYAGTTTVSAGILKAGVATSSMATAALVGIPPASVVTIEFGATLDLDGKSITRTADTTVNGTLALGASGNLFLSSGSHSITNISGSGTVYVFSGATLVLSSSITNTGVNITLAGGTLKIAAGTTSSIGTLAQSAASFVDFSNTGDANLTVATLTNNYPMGVTSWTSGSDHFYATAVSGSPAKNTPNANPLYWIALGSNAASQTYWATSTELLAAPAPGNYTYWDGPNTTANNNPDGGNGTWDASSTTNWTTSDGSFNSTWAGGTAIANFGGTLGTVTVSGSPSIGGLNFTTSGYQITGGTSLTLAQSTGNPITTPSGGSATIATPISGSYPMSFSGGTATLSGSSTGYTGAITVNAGATLIAANANALGATGSSNVTVNTGASLGVTGGVTVQNGQIKLNGTGVGGAGALYNVAGNNVINANLTLGSDATVSNNVSGTTLTNTAIFYTAGYTVTLDGSATLSMSAIRDSGSVIKTGSGTALIGGTSNYTGNTTVNGGTLTYGATDSIPPASVVSVGSTATLNLNGTTQTRTASTAVDGTLALGASGVVTLNGGVHSIGSITGSGTINVTNGATLTLTKSFDNSNVNISIQGNSSNSLKLAAGVDIRIGTLRSANFHVDFGGSGAATLRVVLLNLTGPVYADNWVSGVDHFYAASFTSDTGSPPKDTPNVYPTTNLTLGTNANTQTYWASANNELLAGPAASNFTYWDGPNTTANNNPDGGNGTWDVSTTANWTTSDGSFNSTWAGGTAIANFGGTLGTVTVSGSPSIGGLNFTTSGYQITGGTQLTLAQASTVTTPAGGSATIATPIVGSYALSFAGGTTTLSGTNSYTGTTTVNSGTLRYGVAGGIPSSSVITVDPTGTLDINGLSFARAADATINGTLAMGTAGGNALTLTGTTTTKVAAVTGKGTIIVSTNATLVLTGTFNNPDLTIRLNGGTLKIATGAQPTVGELLVTSATGTLDMDSTGAAQVTFNTMTLSTNALVVNNWTSGSDHVYVTAFTSATPARNQFNIAPLNQITLGTNGANRTFWSSAASGSELLVGATASALYTYWDTVPGNNQVDGGSGTWDTGSVFWTNVGGSPNAPWYAGNIARFAGTAGTVTVSGTQYITGLSFEVDGYTITGGTQLSLNTASAFSTSGSSMTAVIATPLEGSYSTTFSTGTIVIAGTAKSTFTGTATVMTGGTLQIGNGGTDGDLNTVNQIKLDTGTKLSFKRSDTYTFSRPIAQGTAGTSTVSQDGSGITVLSNATNGYTGPTLVNAGTLRYGADTAIPATSQITGQSGATLDVANRSVTRSANTVVNGTLNLGDGIGGSGSMTLTTGSHSIANLTGKGTITVNGTATLTLASGVNAPNVTIVLAGGTLSVGVGTAGVSIGTLQQSSASTVDFASGGNATLTVGTLTITSGTLTANNWTAGSDHFYATSVTGTPTPARNTTGIAPLNQISLGGNPVSQTYWASGTNELLVGAAGSYTYWDTTSGNSQVDGGVGTWNTSNSNWSTSTGSFNGPWAGGSNTASFGGTAGAVTVDTTSGVPSIGGLSFTVSGYTVSGGSLALAQSATVTTPSSGTTTINTPISGSGYGLSLTGGGTLVLGGTNTYTGNTSINAGTLVVNGSTAAGSTVNVNASTTLGGSGTAAGSVNVSGTLSPGASATVGTAGTLSTGTLTFTGGSSATLAMDLGTSGTTGGGVNDLVQVSGDLNLNNVTLSINKLSGFSTAGSYVLMTYTGTRTGTFGSNNLAAIGYLGLIQYDDTNKQVKLVSIPRVRIAQTSNGGIGTFGFVMSGLDTSSVQLTTETAGTAVTSAVYSGSIGTAVSIAQTPPLGWPSTPASISCVDASGASNGNGTGSLGSVSGSTVSLTAAQMRAGADITCSFTNANNGISGVVFNDGGAPSGGSNTGTPNDGIRNGSEQGISGATVSLTNCAGTTYASATTDGGGAYSLAVPTAQNGQGVCVVLSMPSSGNTGSSNYIATGANVGGTVLADGSSTSASGTSYTYSRANRRVSFTAATNGQAAINFGEVPASVLTPTTSSRSAAAGVNAVHAHSFTAGTGGVLALTLGTGTATPSTVTGWSEIAYLDPGCTGTVQANATRLYPTGTAQVVTQGQVLCFVVQERVPAIAGNGNSNAVPVTATLTLTNASPALSASYTATDTTTASSTAVVLNKTVRNVTQGVSSFATANQAKPGDVLEYRISYENTTPSPVNTLVINDATPTSTTFVSAGVETTPTQLGTCQKNTPANAAPAAGVDCAAAQTAGGTGSVSWKFSGSLPGGTSGAVIYRVQVD